MVQEIRTFTEAKRIIRTKARVCVTVYGMPDTTIDVVKADLLHMIQQAIELRTMNEEKDAILNYDGESACWLFYPDFGNHGVLIVDGGF